MIGKMHIRIRPLVFTALLTSLFVLSMFAVLPINAASSSSGQSGMGEVTIVSVNQNGTPIYGYYALVCSQGTSGSANGTNDCDSPPYNARYASGFTTVTFSNFGVPANQTIGIEVENYGSCTFSYWANNPSNTYHFELVEVTNPPTTYTAVYNCASTTSSVTISSQNQNGQTINGYYVELYNSQGRAVGTGFTTKTFDTTANQMYSVAADSYGSCIFNHWSDDVTSNPRSFTASNNPMSFTAVYNCGTSSSSVTINSVNQNGNTINGYYTVLYSSSGNVIGTGFTTKTFATTSGQLYKVQADSYASCTFNHWSSGMTSDPMPFTATSSAQTFTAVYNCG